jgi:hypothetical protein
MQELSMGHEVIQDLVHVAREGGRWISALAYLGRPSGVFVCAPKRTACGARSRFPRSPRAPGA